MRNILSPFIGLLIIGLLISFSSSLLVDMWWHGSLNYLVYYLMRLGYRDVIVVAISLLQGSFIFLNFILIPTLLQFDPASLCLSSPLKHKVSKLLFKPSVGLFLISVGIFTVPILTPIYLQWEAFLLFYFNSGSSVTDPIFQKDIAFYLFAYPVIKLVQNEMLVVFSLLLATIYSAYLFCNIQLNGKRRAFPTAVKIHITLLALILIGLQGWSIIMQRFDILYIDRHEPIFFGPGFVDMNFHLPLISLTYFVFLGAATAGLVFLYSGRGKRGFLAIVALYLAMIGVKYAKWVPELIDRIYVEPNPVGIEGPNMLNHIKATQQAFGLSPIRELDYPINRSPQINTSAISAVLANIPLWDHDLLLPSFEQLQAIRPYFGFQSISADRYLLGSENLQVNVAARELKTSNLPKQAQNWNNLHFVYTHGYGVAMAYSLQKAEEPMQWLLQNLMPQTPFEQLKLSRPEIYYGLAEYPYAIVPNDASSENQNASDTLLSSAYQGDGGVPISGLFHKLVFSSYFQDANLLFTASTNKNSRVLLRRNIKDSIQRLAPFLTLDTSIYPVISNGKIYWIADAYTTSDDYPLVNKYALPNTENSNQPHINYLRNSVKIIVDAYTGRTDFFIVDANDPIAMTYRNIYPSLFKMASDIPKPFINHLSYPEALFALQMKIYARYHVPDPAAFYQQSETMDFPEVDGKKTLPYYLTVAPENTDQPGIQKPLQFLLVTSLAQSGRDNLRSVVMAGCIEAPDCDSRYVADLLTYKFPANQQIEGPAQITALINQDTEIAQQFALWKNLDIEVIKGRIIIIPIASRMIYVQPIYTAATRSNGFPQLARIVVAMNKVAAMDRTVAGAFNKLQTKLGLTGQDQ